MTDKGREFWKNLGTSFLKWFVAFLAGILGGSL